MFVCFIGLDWQHCSNTDVVFFIRFVAFNLPVMMFYIILWETGAIGGGGGKCEGTYEHDIDSWSENGDILVCDILSSIGSWILRFFGFW